MLRGVTVNFQFYQKVVFTKFRGCKEVLGFVRVSRHKLRKGSIFWHDVSVAGEIPLAPRLVATPSSSLVLALCCSVACCSPCCLSDGSALRTVGCETPLIRVSPRNLENRFLSRAVQQ